MKTNSLRLYCTENNRLELLEEWDIEGNELTPSEVTKGSGVKYKWVCRNNPEHRWESNVYNRVNNNSGCPFCKNSATSLPEQYIYYVLGVKLNNVENRRILGGYEYDIAIRDKKKKIKILIEYDGYYYHRVVNNTEKREKQKERYAKKIKYDFIRIREVMESEEVIMSGNIIEYKSRSNNVEGLNRIIELIIEYINKKYRLMIDSSIPENAEQLSRENAAKELYEKSIEVTHPEIAKLWNEYKNGKLKPSQFSKGTNSKVWWKCEEGHEFNTKISNMVNSGGSCPICSGRQVLKGFNDIGTTHKELLKEWDKEKNIGITPYELSRGSKKKVWWKCEEGHSYKTAVKNRAVINTGCPYCTGIKVLEGFNDIGTTHKDLIDEWDFERNKEIKPEEISRGSNKEIWWICKDNKEHRYKMKINNKVNGVRCPLCREEKNNGQG